MNKEFRPGNAYEIYWRQISKIGFSFSVLNLQFLLPYQFICALIKWVMIVIRKEFNIFAAHWFLYYLTYIVGRV